MLAKPEHENRISHICTDNVKTGIANTLGEQGGPHSSQRAPAVTGVHPVLAHRDLLGLKTEAHVLRSPQSWANQVAVPPAEPPWIGSSASGYRLKCRF